MNEDIKVFGLFGFPVSHSLSPAMHNAALRALQIPGIYLAFERDSKHFLRLLKSKKKIILDGFNLTVPLKEVVIPFLDKKDSLVELTGACNTVKRVKNSYLGFNTDVFGFTESLRQARIKTAKRNAVVLGAGGSARAVITSLALGKVSSIMIFNRTKKNAEAIAGHFQKKFKRTKFRIIHNLNELCSELKNADLIVNTTSVGLKDRSSSPVPKSLMPKRRTTVFDLIYGKKETRFIRDAKSLGHRIVSGEDMLLYQGAKAFEIWTGKKAPITIMRKTLMEGIRNQNG